MLLDEALPLAEAKIPVRRSYLFYGPAGSGKTTLACKHGGSILYVDLDERLHELELTADQKQRIHVWRLNEPLSGPEITTTVIDRTRANPTAGTLVKEEPKGYLKAVRFLNECLALSYKGEFKYDAIVIDSMTRLTSHLTYLVLWQHKVSIITESLYDVVKRNYEQFIWGFLRLPCDRILIAHARHDEKRDKTTGMILMSRTKPYLLGSMSNEISALFSEVYFFLGRKGSEPRYEIQTASDRELEARTNLRLDYQAQAKPELIFGKK